MVVAPDRLPTSQDERAEAFANFLCRPHPSWLKEGRLEDDRWVIETENPAFRRHSSAEIRFDLPISPGRHLNDPDEWRDLLTAKLFVYCALTGPNAWLSTPGTTRIEFGALINFIRWRNNRGLPRMSDLGPAWFEEFRESLSISGREGLLRSEEAARTLIQQHADQGLSPPSKDGKANYFAFEKAAWMMGFDSRQQLSFAAATTLRRWALDHRLALETVPTQLPRHELNELTLSSVRRYLNVWRQLSRLRHEMSHDPLGHSPFEGRRDLLCLARTMSKSPGRTRTPATPQICHLIDRALRWVLFYSDDLRTVVNHLREERRREPEAPARQLAVTAHKVWTGPTMRYVHQIDAISHPEIGPYASRREHSIHQSLRSAFMYLLPGACAIVIAAFSARRAEEILSLRDDCIEDAGGEIWMRSYIAKNLRGRERIPVPAAVAKAVEVLEWLSAEAREQTETRWLFQVLDPLRPDKPVGDMNLARAIKLFADEVNVPALPDGSQWSFLPHQFRRFFAVMYYYRYRDRSLTALSEYLKHYDPDSTRTYITQVRIGGFAKLVDQARAEAKEAQRLNLSEALRRQDFDEVALEFRVDIFRGALEGREMLSGWAGTRIKNDLQRMRSEWESRIEVGDYLSQAPTLDNLLIEFAKSTRLEPNGQGHSYCSCTASEKDTSVAGCVVEARRRNAQTATRQGPDLRFAEDTTCAACVHNVQLSENAQYWREMAEKAEGICVSCPGTVLAEKMAERARIGREHLARFHPGAAP